MRVTGAGPHLSREAGLPPHIYTEMTNRYCGEKSWCLGWSCAQGSGSRLISGNSDNGGASYVNWNDDANDNVGFRPLITSRKTPRLRSRVVLFGDLATIHRVVFRFPEDSLED